MLIPSIWKNKNLWNHQLGYIYIYIYTYHYPFTPPDMISFSKCEFRTMIMRTVNSHVFSGWKNTMFFRSPGTMKSRLPSGYVKIAIENGHRNSGFTQLQNGGSFHSYVNVYQRVNHPDFITVEPPDFSQWNHHEITALCFGLLLALLQELRPGRGLTVDSVKAIAFRKML